VDPFKASPSTGVILSTGAFQPERRACPELTGEGISRGSVQTASPSTGVILSAGAFQPERRIPRVLYPRPEAKGCRGRAVTFASLSTGVILSAGAFQPERRILRGLHQHPGERISHPTVSHRIYPVRSHPEHRRFSAGAKSLSWTDGRRDLARIRSKHLPRPESSWAQALFSRSEGSCVDCIGTQGNGSRTQPFHIASIPIRVILSGGAFQPVRRACPELTGEGISRGEYLPTGNKPKSFSTRLRQAI